MAHEFQRSRAVGAGGSCASIVQTVVDRSGECEPETIFYILNSVQSKLRIRHYNRGHTWAHERKMEALQRLRSGLCAVGEGGMVNEVMRDDEVDGVEDGGGTVELDANHELDESERMEIPASLINICGDDWHSPVPDCRVLEPREEIGGETIVGGDQDTLLAYGCRREALGGVPNAIIIEHVKYRIDLQAADSSVDHEKGAEQLDAKDEQVGTASQLSGEKANSMTEKVEIIDTCSDFVDITRKIDRDDGEHITEDGAVDFIGQWI